MQKEFYETYGDNPIQVPGIQGYEWIGRVANLKKHPLGDSYLRLEDPVCVKAMRNQKGEAQVQLIKMGKGGNYKNFIDIRPEDMPIEVRQLEKGKPLYRDYQKELNRVVSDLIVAPDTASMPDVIGRH